jgi:hypothetical protein
MTRDCEIHRCRDEATITYLDHGVCEKHWNHLTAEDAPPDALRISLGIEATAPAATEDRTMEPEKSTKKSKKAPAKPKAAKEPKTKRERAPKREDLCVFAFRLPIADRDLIHEAADAKKVSATAFVVETILETSRKVLDRS